MVPFAIVLLWKNEKKLVTYSRVLGQAQTQLKKIKIDQPYDENDLCLVACKGPTVNEQDINDYEFGICIKNSYRLKRTVEMYQWI